MLAKLDARLSIAQRLGVLGTVSVAPIALLGGLYWSASQADIAFAQKEIDGVRYAEAVWPALTASLDGRAIDAAAVRAAAQAHGAAMKTEEEAEALLTGEQRAQAEAAAALIAAIGDGSNLILDPDLDSYYAMDAVVVKLPALALAAEDVERRMRALDGRTPSVTERAELIAALARLEADGAAAAHALRASIAADQDGGGAQALSAHLERVAAISVDAVALGRPLALTDGVFAAPADMFESLAAVQATTDGAWMASAAELQRMLERRIRGFEGALTTNLGAVALLIAAAIALGVWIARGLTRRVRGIVGALERLAAKDLTAEPPYTEETNEIGSIARAAATLQQELARTAAIEAAARDAEERAQIERRQALLAMAEAFERSMLEAVDALAAASEEVRASAEALASTADHAAHGAEGALRHVTDNAGHVQSVAAASEELTAAIAQIASEAQFAAQLAREGEQGAVASARRVEELSDAAGQIESVVRLIEAIASQTNLLALNATIEAARAGEAGRGFAVVAAEVKTLAAQTATATEEIRRHVGAIGLSTTETAQAIARVAETLRRNNVGAGEIATAIEQQSAAVQEISMSASAVASSTRDATAAVSLVREAARETGGSAGQSREAARELSSQADRLQRAAATFLHQVRAA